MFRRTSPRPLGLRLFLLITFLVVGVLGVGRFYNQVGAANLTSVSVTTTNSRPSFRGALAAGNTVGQSLAIISTIQNGLAGSYPSTSSAQLVEGDILRIGSGALLRPYTVASTSSLSTISLTAALASGDADAGDDVISTASATLNVRFTTVSALNGGKFRVLVPSVSGSASQDGIPDGGGFDYTASAPTVTCPADFTDFDFSAGTSSPAAVTLGGVVYHSFTCTYVGAGGVGTVFNGTTHDYMQIAGLINPAPGTPSSATDPLGRAFTYSIIVQHLDSSNNVIDSTTAKIAIIEAVKVTASVAPQITFQIIGVAFGTSVCGTTTSITTTASTVPFGDLTVGSFKVAAQGISVSTNAAGGYAVTVAENDQLGRNGGTCTGDPTTATNVNCIQDTRGDAAAADEDTSDEWVSTSQPGFGYSLSAPTSGATGAFLFSESSRTFSARRFADLEQPESPQTILSRSAVTSNDGIHVCYKIMPDATTAAGNYENFITYVATSTF